MSTLFKNAIESGLALDAGVSREPSSNYYTTNALFNDNIFVFKDTATKIGLTAKCVIPGTLVANPKIRIKWACPATSGNADWALDYNSIADGETLDPAAYQRSLNSVVAAPGTTLLQKYTDIALTLGDLTAGDTFKFLLSLDGAGSTTISGVVLIEKVEFVWDNA